MNVQDWAVLLCVVGLLFFVLWIGLRESIKSGIRKDAAKARAEASTERMRNKIRLRNMERDELHKTVIEKIKTAKKREDGQ